MAEDRIARLSERFRAHAPSRKTAADRSRERRSFYLDGELVTRLDRVYRDLNHELYPASLSKSAFLETLLEYGLNHLPELKSALSTLAETPPESEPS
jgi:hypothetical protein